MNRVHVLICVSLLATVSVVAFAARAAYPRVFLKNVYFNTGLDAGYLEVNWLTGERGSIVESWYVETGFLSARLEGEGQVFTEYNSEGGVEVQTRLAPEEEHRYGPPWLFDAKDQASPTAPWYLEDVTFEQWWDSIPEEAKETAVRPSPGEARRGSQGSQFRKPAGKSFGG